MDIASREQQGRHTDENECCKEIKPAILCDRSKAGACVEGATAAASALARWSDDNAFAL